MPFLDPRYVSSGFTSGRGPFCQTGQPPLGAPSNELRPKKQSYGDDGAGRDHPDSDHCRDSRNILLLTSGDRPRWRVARRPRRRDDPESGLRGATQMRELLFCIHTALAALFLIGGVALAIESWFGGWGLGLILALTTVNGSPSLSWRCCSRRRQYICGGRLSRQRRSYGTRAMATARGFERSTF